MSVGVRTRGGWVSMPLWAWVTIGPFVLYVWLMWQVVKWGGIGLYWLAVWNVRFVRWAAPGVARLVCHGIARWQARKAIPAAHP